MIFLNKSLRQFLLLAYMAWAIAPTGMVPYAHEHGGGGTVHVHASALGRPQPPVPARSQAVDHYAKNAGEHEAILGFLNSTGSTNVVRRPSADRSVPSVDLAAKGHGHLPSLPGASEGATPSDTSFYAASGDVLSRVSSVAGHPAPVRSFLRGPPVLPA